MIFTTLFFLLSVFSANSQKNKVTSALNYAKEGILDKAKTSIDEACEYESTKSDASTWKARGVVYLAIGVTTNPEYMKLHPNPLDESYNAVKKSMELDPNGRWIDDNKNILKDLCKAYLNVGINEFNVGLANQDSNNTLLSLGAYTKALSNFEVFWEIIDKLQQDANYVWFDLFQNGNIKRNQIYLWTGYSAKSIKDWEKAKKYYGRIVNLSSAIEDTREESEPSIFIQYADVLDNAKEFYEAIKVVERGKEIWPESKDLVIMELKLYQDNNKMDELAKKLEDALISDPNNINLNATYASTLGSISDSYSELITKEKEKTSPEKPDQNKIKEYNAKYEEYRLKAISAYEKAIEVTKKYKDEVKYKVDGTSPSFDITYKNENGEMKTEKAVAGWEYSFNMKDSFVAALTVKGIDKKTNSVALIYLAGNKVKEVKAEGKSSAKAEYTITASELKKIDNLYDLYYNCGILYFNPGVEIYNEAINTSDEKLMKEFEKKYMDYFVKALPYMEEAYKLNPKAKEAKQVLINIYFKTEKSDKANELLNSK